MSEEIPGWEKPGKREPDKGGGGGGHIERLTAASQSVRVPEGGARGVFATGLVVFTSQNEFVMDFFQGIAKPPQVVARVVMSLAAIEGLINVLRENMGAFSRNFGTPGPIQKSPNERQLSAAELYDELKVPEELQSGSYATGILVNMNPVEFHFDFVTGFFPNASVSSRVYLAAPRVQNMIDTLVNTHSNLVKQRGQGPQIQQPQPPQTPPQSPPNPFLNRPEGPG